MEPFQVDPQAVINVLLREHADLLRKYTYVCVALDAITAVKVEDAPTSE